ncbi:MAG: HTH-type transcriptional activator IlvY [Saccharospirillaceae bacterium]|nr:HTH-type transcriptional activator IlvY [Pseudomonadales bacterium]NRB80737.1 HTH-type transcriptional activator IlvY [Saccharospirillaceae bacterium]
MDIKTLKLYLSLCQTLHFGRSSELMHVSTSTLSRSISRLEQELNVQLFERDNRSVKITAAGEQTRTVIQDMVEQWSTLQHKLDNQYSHLKGQLSIYCSVTASYSLMLDLLTRFRALYPNIEVNLQTGDAALAFEKLNSSQADLAVAPKPEQLDTKHSFLPITTTPLVFIRPTMESQVRKQSLQHQIDWQQLPLIMPQQGLARERLDNWYKQKKIKPNIYSQVAGHEAIVSMVGLGLGVGVVPGIVLEHSPMKEKIETFNVEPKLKDFEVGLCCLKRKANDPLIKAFLSVCDS